jgi:hypothetical protein
VKSIRSLRDLSVSPDNIQILVGYDYDDNETSDVAHNLGTVPVRFEPRLGYSQFHVYVNQLAQVSDGDWLFLWNDDALMTTRCWDVILGGYDFLTPLVLSPSSTGVEDSMCCFPVVSRALYSCLGHLSLSTHVDTWLQDLANSLGLLRKIGVYIYHDRFDFTGGHNDKTYAESRLGYRTKEFHSEPMQALLRDDIEKVRRCLI